LTSSVGAHPVDCKELLSRWAISLNGPSKYQSPIPADGNAVRRKSAGTTSGGAGI
jgi:hypothetical protein